MYAKPTKLLYKNETPSEPQKQQPVDDDRSDILEPSMTAPVLASLTTSETLGDTSDASTSSCNHQTQEEKRTKKSTFSINIEC